MTKYARTSTVLAAVVLLAGATCFAQGPGEATYKAKCQNCHGAAGLAETGMAKALKVKPVTDPAVSKMTLAEMIEATKNGVGKMPAFKASLSEAEIKGSAEVVHSYIK